MTTGKFYGDGLTGIPFGAAAFSKLAVWPRWAGPNARWPVPGRLIGPPKAMTIATGLPNYGNLTWNVKNASGGNIGRLQQYIDNQPPDTTVAAAYLSSLVTDFTARMKAVLPDMPISGPTDPLLTSLPNGGYVASLEYPLAIQYGATGAVNMTPPGKPKYGSNYIGIFLGIPSLSRVGSFTLGGSGTVFQGGEGLSPINAGYPNDFAVSSASYILSQMYWIPRFTAAFWGAPAIGISGPAQPIPPDAYTLANPSVLASYTANVAAAVAAWNGQWAQEQATRQILVDLSTQLNAGDPRCQSIYGPDLMSITSDDLAAVVEDTWGLTV